MRQTVLLVEEVDMSEQSEVNVSTPSSTVKRSGLLDGVRQLTYAWVGMWSVASDDLGDFYTRCVARGEQVMNAKPPAARPEVKPPDAAVALPKTAASRAIRPMSIVNMFGAVESYHIDLNAEGILLTKQELDALSERVDALSREVNALSDQRKEEQ
jgi:hypothetical protein